MEETEISIVTSGGRVVAEVGTLQLYTGTYANYGENHTLVCSVGVDRSATRPLFIFKESRINLDKYSP